MSFPTTPRLRLWTDEMEGLRAGARAAVDDAFALFPDLGGGGGGGSSELSVEERVRRQRAQMPMMPVPEGADRQIAGIRCRVFLPDGPPRAVYLHFHGGGMVTGAPELMDWSNRDVARTHSVAVVSPDYRKAPEHPYPAGPDDGVAVARWLVEHAPAEFGTDRLLMGGESAGGYMAAVVALRLRDLGLLGHVGGLNLVFGVFDWGRTPSQRGVRAQAGPDLLDPQGICFMADCYLPGMTDDERRDPAISPAFADLHDLPPCLLSVGTCDHLFDDSVVLAGRAAAAGVDVELFVAPEMPHGFMLAACPMTDLWQRLTREWFERRLA